MHKDHYENMYAVIKGTKTFILHPPTDLPCIPYKHYTVCRYMKNQVGKYIITQEKNKEHCEHCCKDTSIVTTEENNLFETSTEVYNNSNCVEELNHINSDICLKEEKKTKDIIFNASSYIQNINCKCTCHDSSTIPWVAIDPLFPDFNKYPSYRHAHQLKVTVNPGDLLYLPSLWFHHVEQTNGTIALNFWYDMEYDIKYNYYKFVENVVHSHLKICK